ncbi:unnamed protein product [Anisakis simplex]|uniref:Fasciclin-1 (inferred by orthology to a D. melanogaster protein) n=1 Tax=Anisakis simplex TaxID=6269 RepID=A0A0M3JF18_ANISI|nr:unnamed protein product [Anisakis simplex]
MYTDLRERTYVMMNDEMVVVRRRGRYFELYWPRGNRVARILEGGQIGGINGYMHLIDNVLIYEPDLRATACAIVPFDYLLIVCLILLYFNNNHNDMLRALLYLVYISGLI